MVVSASTNGTCATAHAKRSGRMFTTAPMSRPPALRPRIASRLGFVKPSSTSRSAHAMKSVNVLALWRNLPSSYHPLPTSPHVGDGEDEAAVQHAQPDRVEHRVAGDLVRAIAVEQRGVRAILHQ